MIYLMYPKTDTCFKYSRIVIEVVESFKQMLGMSSCQTTGRRICVVKLKSLKCWKDTDLDGRSAWYSLTDIPIQ